MAANSQKKAEQRKKSLERSRQRRQAHELPLREHHGDSPGIAALRQRARVADPDIAVQETVGPKLSDRLMTLVPDQICKWQTLDELRLHIRMAQVGWNLSHLSTEMVQKFLESTEPRVAARLLALMLMKIRHFPDDARFVLDFELTGTAESYFLAVSSTTSPKLVAEQIKTGMRLLERT